MDLRGQRFTVDLSDDPLDDHDPPRASPLDYTSPLIADITERTVTAPPTLPVFKNTPTGFPQHKKRHVSTFKQQKASTRPVEPTTEPPRTTLGRGNGDPGVDEAERRKIDEENRRVVAAMSEQEIDRERQELLDALDPSLVQRLLQRANLEDGRGDTGLYPSGEAPEERKQDETHRGGRDEADGGVPVPQPPGRRVIPAASVVWEDEDEAPQPGASTGQTEMQKPRAPTTSSKWVTFDDDAAEPTQPIDLQPAANPALAPSNIHFPQAPAAPSLDPADPEFLTTLHAKYFPTLAADPTKLAWMLPVPTPNSPADQDSPYSPAQAGLHPSALRFDFRGALLPPRIARAVPTTRGLHHHGEAPEAAGYTVPELARLARSAFPAQRCVAFQTLGRLLYRLGRGEWGEAGAGHSAGAGAGVGEISNGLWRCVEEGGVLTTLQAAAAAEGGHQGSRAYAMEAVWLWQRGGGKVWKSA